MPALVRLTPGRVDARVAVGHSNIGAWDVQVDRQETAGPHQQVVGEDGVHRADSRAAAPEQARAGRDLGLLIHVP